MFDSAPFFMQAQDKIKRHIPVYVHALFSIRKKQPCPHLLYGKECGCTSPPSLDHLGIIELMCGKQTPQSVRL